MCDRPVAASIGKLILVPSPTTGPIQFRLLGSIKVTNVPRLSNRYRAGPLEPHNMHARLLLIQVVQKRPRDNIRVLAGSLPII